MKRERKYEMMKGEMHNTGRERLFLEQDLLYVPPKRR
jgi:hypothetical protein